MDITKDKGNIIYLLDFQFFAYLTFLYQLPLLCSVKRYEIINNTEESCLLQILPWPLAGESEENYENIRTGTNLLDIKTQYPTDICKVLHYNNLLDTSWKVTIWKHKEME